MSLASVAMAFLGIGVGAKAASDAMAEATMGIREVRDEIEKTNIAAERANETLEVTAGLIDEVTGGDRGILKPGDIVDNLGKPGKPGKPGGAR